MVQNNKKNYKFYVKGMHCQACTILIEEKIKEFEEVEDVRADLANMEVSVSGNFSDLEDAILAERFSEKIRAHGYSLFLEKPESKINWSDFRIAFPLAVVFIFVFVLLQRFGIVNLISVSKITFGTAFLVGIIASLSTCMAVVGGLLLSLSASFAKKGETLKPQIMFHLGRLVSFFVLGGVIGLIGSAFQLSGLAHTILNTFVAIVMLILGLNLLDVFQFAKKFQPTMPAFISRGIWKKTETADLLIAVLAGGATFFMPCGFTQSMQIFALSTGSFWSGAVVMIAFALGTLPVLSLLSFSSVNINKSRYSGIFFKTVGLVVIAFAIYNFITILAVAGVIPPLLIF